MGPDGDTAAASETNSILLLIPLVKMRRIFIVIGDTAVPPETGAGPLQPSLSCQMPPRLMKPEKLSRIRPRTGEQKKRL
jgi:hypothetical protein